MKAMPYAELPGFVMKLRAMEGVGCRALEFTILTAGRSGEALGVRWSEIDLEGKVWTVPATRTKAGREHRVPLSRRCLTILREMQKLRVSDFVFPGFREGRPLWGVTLTDLLRRMGTDVSVHGFRSTFRDWCGDCTPYPREIAEAALAHVVGNAVERASRRGSAFEQRANLMEDWATFCEAKTGRVIHLRRIAPPRR